MIKIQFFLAAVISLLAITNVTAQQSNTFHSSDYTTSVGVKFYPGALTIKHFINDNNALEGLGYFWSQGLRFTGLYEFHYDINSIEGLKWYLGPGAHLGFYNTNSKNTGGTSIGIDGVLGLDYKIADAPINLSLDWQPFIEFGGGDYNGFNGSFAGLGIRYTL